MNVAHLLAAAALALAILSLFLGGPLLVLAVCALALAILMA